MLAPVRSGFVCWSCRAQIRLRRLRQEGGRRWTSSNTVPGAQEGPLHEKREKTIQDPSLVRQRPRPPEGDAAPADKEAFKSATERMQRMQAKHWFTQRPSEDFWDHVEESVIDAEAIDPLVSQEISLGRQLDGSEQAQLDGVLKQKANITKSERWALEERYFVQKAQFRYLKRGTPADGLPDAERRFKDWKRRFHAIWNAHVLGIDAGWDVVSGRSAQAHKTEELMRLVALEDSEALASEWFSKPWEERVMLWPNLMAAALSSASHKCHVVLQATWEPGASPSYVAQDLLLFLMWWAHYLETGRRVEVMDSLCDVLLYILDNSEPGSMIIRDAVLAFCLRDLAPPKAAQLLVKLQAYGFLFNQLTLLQFANRLARDFNTKPQSVDILRFLLEQGKLTWDDPKIMALSTAILTLSKGQVKMKKGGSIVIAQLFRELLDLGLRPNAITYTCLLRNFCLDGRFGTAFKIYENMMDEKVEPVAVTYSVLMNGAKRTGEYDLVGRLAADAMAQKLGDFVIFNDALHSVLMVIGEHAKKTSGRGRMGMPLFRPMLQVYAKFFKLAPLQRLVQTDLSAHLESTSDPHQDPLAGWADLQSIRALAPLAPEEKLDPHPTTLGMMLIGYLRNLRDAFDVVSFYAHLRALVQCGDPVAVRLLRTTQTLVYDSMLFCLVKSKAMLRIALDMIAEMLRDATEAEEKEVRARRAANDGPVPVPADDLDLVDLDLDDQDGLPLHARPSVYTWSIMVHGLMRHRFTEQAERVLDTMRDHGVRPNVVTWNTLLSGYARLQMLQESVGTLQRLEDSGLDMDSHTGRAFSHLDDRDGALRLLGRQLEKNKKKQKKKEEEEEEKRDEPERVERARARARTRARAMPTRLLRQRHCGGLDEMRRTVREVSETLCHQEAL